MATVLPSFPDKMLNSNEIRTSAIVQESSQNDDDEENECYVPTEHTFPNLIRHEYGFERVSLVIQQSVQYHIEFTNFKMKLRFSVLIRRFIHHR